jgi:hypothetical protein
MIEKIIPPRAITAIPPTYLYVSVLNLKSTGFG